MSWLAVHSAVLTTGLPSFSVYLKGCYRTRMRLPLYRLSNQRKVIFPLCYLSSHSTTCIEVTVQSLGSSSCKSVEDMLSEGIYETWHFVAHRMMTRKSEWLGN